MDITVLPQRLKGSVDAVPSKSQAHRLMICAAFADKETLLICPDTNRDIEATADCLKSLGAKVIRISQGYRVIPVSALPEKAVLNCGESGSTLRFMLPIAGALGIDATFLMNGRLPCRPLSPLWEEMERMGCTLSRPTATTLRCTGKLKSGVFTIDGSISSQFVTGLLLACSLIEGKSRICVTGELHSKPYVDMTLQAMKQFGVNAATMNLTGGSFRSPQQLTVEGDWSNAAFFLAANALGNEITVGNLNAESSQGDKAIIRILEHLEDHISISCRDIPDLVPILCVVAAAKHGAVFTDIRRLRLKESDRVISVIAMLEAMGAKAYADENTLTVLPCVFEGGTVDSFGDHRIAMAAAIAATVAQGPVTILDAHCASKSYPRFWEDYRKLGGSYEQYIW